MFRDRIEQERYLADGWKRMLIVIEMLSELATKDLHHVLELGANPYIMTLMMKRRFGFELKLANYFSERLTAQESVHVAELNGVRIEFPFCHFNIEPDVFPYPDEQFDCVLFCEILEHLLESPDRAVAELARVLRPGGYVIVSTPNATRLTNLYFLLLGHNIWDRYSPNGPYGRHNREFTLAEVRDLLEHHGFHIVRTEVRNIQRWLDAYVPPKAPSLRLVRASFSSSVSDARAALDRGGVPR